MILIVSVPYELKIINNADQTPTMHPINKQNMPPLYMSRMGRR